MSKKDLETFHIEEKIGKKLKARQELFCVLYSGRGGKYCFANATTAYMEAYDLTEKQADSARSSGYRLLTNVHILKRIKRLMKQTMAPATVNFELAKIIYQDSDLHAKLGAIAQYHKVMGKEPPKDDKLTIVWGGEERDGVPYVPAEKKKA